MDEIRLNSFDIISEASISDFSNISEIDVAESILNLHDSIEELEENVIYTAEMIPVVKVNESIVVDYFDLNRLMESNNIHDEEDAIKLIAEHYNILDHNISILIESEEAFSSNVSILLEKIKREKDPIVKDKLKKRLDSINNKIKTLSKNSNINLVKKKNKHNK